MVAYLFALETMQQQASRPKPFDGGGGRSPGVNEGMLFTHHPTVTGYDQNTQDDRPGLCIDQPTTCDGMPCNCATHHISAPSKPDGHSAWCPC